MAEHLHLSLVTPEKQVVNEEVEQVNVPGSEGDLGILYHHAPIITNHSAHRERRVSGSDRKPGDHIG